jgi:hypothetical protein
MRRLPAVLVALTAAAALALLASLASAAGAQTCKTDPDTVRAGQTVKAYGKGCRSRGYVRIYLDRVEIDNDRADRAGVFVDYVEIPNSADPGEHCPGRRPGSGRRGTRRTAADRGLPATAHAAGGGRAGSTARQACGPASPRTRYPQFSYFAISANYSRS